MKKTIGLFALVLSVTLMCNVASARSAVPKTEMAFSIPQDVQVATITSNNPVNFICSDSYLNAEVYVSVVAYYLENADLVAPKVGGLARIKPVSIEEHRKPPRWC